MLADKTILITGASGGIGEACVIEAADSGARVILTGRNEEKLKSVLLKLHDKIHDIAIVDLTNDDSIDSVVKSIFDKHGQIHGFIHAAGFEITKPLRKTTREDFRSLLDINAFSGFSFVRSIMKLKKNKVSQMSFVIISSIMGNVANRGLAAYCASKGAVISGVKAIALELADKGHRINSVSPGIVNTPIVKKIMEKYPVDMKERILKTYPLGTGQPKDVAELCNFLLSDRSRWITGTDFVIDGGYSAK